MRKYFLLAGFLVLNHVTIIAQRSHIIKRDSLVLDSLRSLLPTLRDTSRIIAFNNIAEAFMNRYGFKLKMTIDSASPYALTAHREATQINYKRGIAYSLLNLCVISNLTFFFNRSNSIDNASNFRAWEEYQKQLLSICSQVNDPQIWTRYYNMYAMLLVHENKHADEILSAWMKGYEWVQKTGDLKAEADICNSIYFSLIERGEFERAFEYGDRALKAAKKLNENANLDPTDYSNELVQQGLINMSELYKTAGDYETALEFLRESRQFHARHNALNTWGMEGELGDIFLLAGQVDSAYYYIQPLTTNSFIPAFQWPRIADVHFLKRQYDSALYFYNKTIDTMKIRAMIEGPQYALMRSYYGKARIYAMNKEFLAALTYARESYRYALNRVSIEYLLNNYNLLSELFHTLGRNDSAYLYSRKYIRLKDSILTRQFYFRLNNYKKVSEDEKKVSQIILLHKENQLKEQKLRQQVFVRNSLILGIVLFFLLGIFFFRNLLLKRNSERLQLSSELERQGLENDKKQAELRQQAVELEMQALRAQMNPHFIFNCLSSINRFIFKNETKAASDYLTRFSRLIRMVLMHSQKKLIPLEDELEMLRLYLDMERLRFKNAFDYTISTTNAVESTAVFIPPLLLQPFCENAIWHGLMHKDGPGHLNISISEEDKTLCCIIEDDGIGREKAAALKSKSVEKEKSFGLQITTKRLALLNGENSSETFYEIDDIVNESGEVAGTKVSLRIRYKESIEELV